MKIRLFLVMAAILIAGPALAQKIYIDYDKDYDGSHVKTFAWAKTSETSLESSDPLLHSRILNAIEHYITLNGVREVDENPDVHVTYHASSKEELSVNTTNWGYGYPSGWGYGRYGGYGGYYGRYYGGSWGGYGGSSSTTVSTYQVGTLVIDIWDAKTKGLVWRGMAANITVSENPTKMTKRIDKALKKMVNAWEKIKKNR
jgi:hypothetical protein